MARGERPSDGCGESVSGHTEIPRRHRQGREDPQELHGHAVNRLRRRRHVGSSRDVDRDDVVLAAAAAGVGGWPGGHQLRELL